MQFNQKISTAYDAELGAAFFKNAREVAFLGKMAFSGDVREVAFLSKMAFLGGVATFFSGACEVAFSGEVAFLGSVATFFRGAHETTKVSLNELRKI